MNKKLTIAIIMVVIGASTVIGSGAYSAAEMDRDANIDVVNDADGLVALESQVDGDVVREDDGGELAIDFTAGGQADGVNVNSRYQVGVFTQVGWAGQQAVDAGALEYNGPQAGPDPAFLVTNQDTTEHDITVSYEADASDLGGSILYMQFVPGIGGSSQAGKAFLSATGTDNGFSYTADVGPGESIAVVIMTDTRNGDTTDDLSGTLTVSSE